MSVGYFCAECRWNGLTCPPEKACPQCGCAVVACVSDAASSNKAPLPAATSGADKRQLTARYEKFARRLSALVAEKQHAYGDSFRYAGDVLKLFFPDGIPVERYGDLLTITRIVDKLFRVANQKDFGGESPYEDIAGYAMRAACENDEGVVATPDNESPIELG